jgi:glucose/arabinose dehydrogenase
MRSIHRLAGAAVAALALCAAALPARAQPSLVDPALDVRTVVAGLEQPIHMAFLAPNDFLVLEKATGRIKRVVDGALTSVVLDLAVNSASERGLLSIALHPQFPVNPGVYLYWSESSTGADTDDILAVPLLGNRVDRFTWNGSTLTFDRNLIALRAFQHDAGQPPRGNHDGGVIRFAPRNAAQGRGPDDGRAKLFVIIGDVGRRGFLQNNLQGPVPDDQFGGPEPDDAHLTGVVLRLNDDGSAPADNPFFQHGRRIGGEVGENVQRIYAFGFRNSFGMDFDPLTGHLWTQENGDDTFTELNLVRPGHNGGWIQVMGPLERIEQYKLIETTQFGGALQQIRWPPTLIADSAAEARQRMFRMPGSRYGDPEFSWKYELPPAGIGFVRGNGLGPEYAGDLILGAARTGVDPSTVPGANVISGHLFRMKLNPARTGFEFTDPRLADKVADNLDKHDITESESLLFGRGFGVGADVRTGPNGNLYVVSLTDGAVYEIFRK